MAKPQLDSANQALAKEGGIIVVKFNREARRASSVLQQRRGPGRFGPVSDRHRIKEKVEECVANVIPRWIGAGTDNQLVMVAEITEIGLPTGERLDIHRKSPRTIRLYDFTKVTRDREGNLRDRSAIDFHAALVVRLIVLPELIELRLAIEVGQNLVEAFQCERVRRQFVPAQFKLKFWRWTRRQCKGNKPRKRRPGVRESVLPVILAQSVDGRALQCKHPLAQLDTPGTLIGCAHAGVESGGIESAKRREQLRPCLNGNRAPCFFSEGGAGFFSCGSFAWTIARAPKNTPKAIIASRTNEFVLANGRKE